MPTTIYLDYSGEHLVGEIPSFFQEDERFAREQIDERYIDGFHPIDGCSFDPLSHVLDHPGLPPLQPVALVKLKYENVFIYPRALVVIANRYGDFEVARLD